jgi:tetraacyldisaccharide-1-P 4'-kinase
MSISTATLISLDDALCHPNYSYVDVIVVVAKVRAIGHHTFFPNGIRELTLKDDTCAYSLLIM